MNQKKKILRGEAALVLAVIINSLGVLLMLQSGSGISAISSVPYAFQQVIPKLTLGTWTYLFQGLLICILMIMRKKFVPSYLFSFVVGFAFGEMMDLHELWITQLPLNIPLRILYFVLSYIIICFGIALSNRCKLPIIPTDLFPREVSEITKVPYARIKIGFDVTCLVITACMTFSVSDISWDLASEPLWQLLQWEKELRSSETGWIGMWGLFRFCKKTKLNAYCFTHTQYRYPCFPHSSHNMESLHFRCEPAHSLS